MRSAPDTDLRDIRADDALLALARRGKYLVRGFAFLALGHVLHVLRPAEMSDAGHAWREEALAVLRDASTAKKVEPRQSAAAATALGMARDGASRERLLGLFEDQALAVEVRCAAAHAYGMNGEDPGNRGLKRFRVAIAGEEFIQIRRAALRGHALLGHPLLALAETDGVDRVLADLAAADSDAQRAEAILLLAHDADFRALVPLLALLEDGGQSDETRALAAMALGCLGDLEWLPSLDRLREDVSFRSVGAETWRIFRLH